MLAVVKFNDGSSGFKNLLGFILSSISSYIYIYGKEEGKDEERRRREKMTEEGGGERGDEDGG